MLLDLQPYEKLIAVDAETLVPLTQHKATDKPKVYTVESIFADDTFRLFQVGTYKKPLHFDANGYPLLDLSYKWYEPIYKIWKRFKLVRQNNATEQQQST